MARMPLDENGYAVPVLRPNTSQMVAIGAASVQSAAVAATTEIVRLVATVDCFVAFGTNPTAVANTSMRLVAGLPELFRINSSAKVAVIQASGGGSLYITEMNWWRTSAPPTSRSTPAPSPAGAAWPRCREVG